MGTMATKKTAKTNEVRCHEDEFGVVHWHSFSVGGTYHSRGHEPFTQMLKVLNDSPAVPQRVKDAAIHVHDDLEIAQSIAVSMFGKHWREHVMQVYDRMQARSVVEKDDLGEE